jgi:inorganic pyrophosphatase
MTTSLLIREAEHFEIARFKRPRDIKSLRQTHVAFSGSPRKHPYDPHRVILVVDPYGTSNQYYEFSVEDIAFIEELPNLVTVDEDVVPVVRLWVRKGSIGIRSTPFWVEDFS